MLRGKTDAETCRINGWHAGTVLIGDEGYGPEKIKITAIGESAILARTIETGKGVAVDGSEGLWTLVYREWSSAAPGDTVDGLRLLREANLAIREAVMWIDPHPPKASNPEQALRILEEWLAKYNGAAQGSKFVLPN